MGRSLFLSLSLWSVINAFNTTFWYVVKLKFYVIFKNTGVPFQIFNLSIVDFYVALRIFPFLLLRRE